MTEAEYYELIRELHREIGEECPSEEDIGKSWHQLMADLAGMDHSKLVH